MNYREFLTPQKADEIDRGAGRSRGDAVIATPIPVSGGRQAEFQFYPTPPHIVRQLVAPYYGRPARMLEPSAGRGDILDALPKRYDFEISCCEVSADLRAILIGKGYKIIGADFLSMEAPYLFTLIIMNPPFAQCAEHVLKAWNMLTPDGELAAVIPQTALGKGTGKYPELNQIIDLFGATEDIGAAFKSAPRSTDVPCVIVRLKKPARQKFEAFSGFTPKMDEEYVEQEAEQLPAPRDLIRAIVAQYQAAMRALKAAHEADMYYRSLVPHQLFEYEQAPSYSAQIDKTKEAFWNLIFERTQIGEVTTSGYRKEFMEARLRLSQMEFSEQTIYEVLHHFMSNRNAILHECVMDVFKQLTNYSRDNAVKSERWATNKSWKLCPKIIIPYAIDTFIGWHLSYRRDDVLNDMDKVLTLFGGTNGNTTTEGIRRTLDTIKRDHVDYMQKFETPNFFFRVYKKGTLHLWFRDLKALEMINRYAAEHNLFVLGSGR